MTNWVVMGEPSTISVLVDGVPVWLRRGMKDWLRRVLFFHAVGSQPWKNLALVREFDQRTQREFPLGDTFEDLGFDDFEREIFDEHEEEDNVYIKFLDYLVFKLSSDNGNDLSTLEKLLVQSGSKWKVGTRLDAPGLEERVPEGVQLSADAAMARPGHAGELLAEAWHAAFGVNPDHEKAYAKSIKAVEAAAIPAVSPRNSRATLGTVIADMKHDANWALDISREHSSSSTQIVILGMAQALWTGQNDRHAGQPSYTPSTQSDAEAAVFLAVPLVQWFLSGAVARR